MKSSPRFRIVYRGDRTFILYDREGPVFEEDIPKIFSHHRNWYVCKVCGELLTARSAEELERKICEHEHELTFISKSRPKIRFRRGVNGV